MIFRPVHREPAVPRDLKHGDVLGRTDVIPRARSPNLNADTQSLSHCLDEGLGLDAACSAQGSHTYDSTYVIQNWAEISQAGWNCVLETHGLIGVEWHGVLLACLSPSPRQKDDELCNLSS